MGKLISTLVQISLHLYVCMYLKEYFVRDLHDPLDVAFLHLIRDFVLKVRHKRLSSRTVIGMVTDTVIINIS